MPWPPNAIVDHVNVSRPSAGCRFSLQRRISEDPQERTKSDHDPRGSLGEPESVCGEDSVGCEDSFGSLLV